MTDEDLRDRRERRRAILVDTEVDGEPYRVLTVAVAGLGAAQIGRSLAGVEGVLADLRILLGLLVAGGIAIAAALAWIVSRRVIAPIASLTEAAEHVSETEDLSMRIPASGEDELGRLASRFNVMLETSSAPAPSSPRRWARSGSSLPTPPTSCARRSPRCAPTSNRCSSTRS